MRTIYITDRQIDVIERTLNESTVNESVVLNEENKTQKKKCVENITNNCNSYFKRYLDMKLTDLPYNLQSMLNPDGQLFQVVSNAPEGVNRFIDYLRLNLYSQFGIKRGSSLVYFIPGISRIACRDLRYYAFDFSIRGGDIIKLNRLLKLLDKKPEVMKIEGVTLDSDFNGMSYDELMGLFSDKLISYREKINSDLLSKKYEVVQTPEYTIIEVEDEIVDGYGGKVARPTNNGRKLLNKLGRYTDWCICNNTHADEEYAQYLSSGGKAYVCLKKGFENIERPQQDEVKTPLDEYGLSLICVIVGSDGLPDNITTRYNHDFDGENHGDLWEATHLQELLQVNYFDVFKPRNEAELRLMNLAENKVPTAQDQINGKVNAGIMDAVTGCGVMEEEMLCENQNDKLANDYIKNIVGIDDFQEIRDIVFQVCHAVPSVRFNKRYYLLGVLRLIFEEKVNGSRLSELDNILYNIRERNEILDRNLDGLSFEELKNEYYEAEIVTRSESVEKIRKTPTGYVIKHIESYDESYNSGPHEWCITYEEEYYYEVINSKDCIYIVENPTMMKTIDKNSREFMNAAKMMGNPTIYELGEYGSGEPPYDTFGLSRFVVLVNPHKLSVYSRWNVPDELDGNFLSKEELEEVLGLPFNEAFPYVEPDDVDDEIKQEYCLRESVENIDDEFKIDGVTEETTFSNAFKPIANFMKNEGLNVYPFPDIELNWEDQDGLFIKTGYYLPGEKKVVLFCKDRHPKDILRSYAHEMIHHMQNLDGRDLNFTSDDDVKDNDKLEKLESEAYLKGNIYFRKWTEYVRRDENNTLNESILKESPDYIEGTQLNYTMNNAIPFLSFIDYPNEVFVGEPGDSHWGIINDISECVFKNKEYYRISDGLRNSIENDMDITQLDTVLDLRGRCWVEEDGGGIISIWDYDKNDYKRTGSELIRAIEALQDSGVNIDIPDLDFDDWKNGNGKSSRYPFTWLLNDMAEIFMSRATHIIPNNGIYVVYCDNGNVLNVDRGGNVLQRSEPKKNSWGLSFSRMFENTLNESPDRVEEANINYDDDNTYPFLVFNGFPNDPIFGIEGQTHGDLCGEISECYMDFDISDELKAAITNKTLKPILADSYDLQGRFFGEVDLPWAGNVISVYDYNKNNLSAIGKKLYPVIKGLSKWGVYVNLEDVDFDDWIGNKSFRYPFTWLTNGLAQIYVDSAYSLQRDKSDERTYTYIGKNGVSFKLDAKGNILKKELPSLAENTIYAPKVDESLSPSEVDLSSFNIKKELNPKFWKDDKLDSRIRIKLLDIADDFIEFLGVDWVKPEDITITGSLANYNWNKKYSDIDLHILIDYSKVDKRTDFVDNYFYSQKKLWNEEHKDLRIFGFPVEVYVQDVNKKHTSSGVYSLEKNEWVIEPEREKLSKKKVNKERIKKTVSQYTEKIDALVNDSKNTNGDEYKMRKVYEASQKLFDEIKKLRKKELSDANNEINEGNIIFKALRRLGYIDKLDKVINKGYNTLNSLP